MGPGALALVLSWLGCQGPPSIKLPETITCAKTQTAGPDLVALKAALAKAQPKDCVVAAAGRYSGSLVVPKDVTLAAELGTKVEVTGENAGTPAVTLAAGANLSGIRVVAAPGIGVSILGGNARLLGVVVDAAASVGVVAWCEEDCLPWQLSVLQDVELTSNAVGLLVHAAPLRMTGGRISGSHALGLAAGYGVVASSGASLEMIDTVVEQNESLGILVDGTLGTSATLQRVTVKKNLGRGVWAQALAGTASAPKLLLDSCTLESYALVGIGARASRGVLIKGGRIASTALGKGTTAMPGVLVDVGDGVGLFDTSGDVRVENVTIDANQRSQVLIDQGSTGLTVAGATVTAQAGQLGIVVQRTSEVVQAPMITNPMPGSELSISAPTLALPAR